MMPAPNPVSGFFDTVADAQEAIQGLLGAGFSGERLRLSTQSDQQQAENATEANANTGRFLTSLFGTEVATGSPNGSVPDAAGDGRSGASVLVIVATVAEADLAVRLLTLTGTVER